VVGLERVGGDHHLGQVEVGQQWLQAGDLAGGAIDLALGQHHAAGVVHTGKQVDLAAVVAGAAQRLAVHGHRPRPPRWPRRAVAVGEPGADGVGEGLRVQARQGPADGGLGGDGEVPGGVAAGTECGPHRLGRIGGPLGDRGHRPGAGQDRGGGDGQDGDERMAAATGSSGVGDSGQVGEQVWVSPSWKGSAWVSWASAAGIGDDGSAGTGVRRGHEALRTA
jgi:hypothetical protein